MSVYFDSFRKSFREVHSVSRDLVLGSLNARDHELRKMMSFALSSRQASDYTHVFQYAFCRTERDSRKIIKLSAAVHLLQSSSFITDDIFDQAFVRYGKPAMHQKYGVSYAIIAAELLQTVAMETISAELDRGSFHNPCLVLRIFNQMMRELYVGQYLDIFYTGNVRIRKQEYFRVIALGVGNFFGHIARCGALLAGKPESEVSKLASFAYHYGMALFITDDIVDVADRPQVTGKTYASDLKNRRMRLPVIFALEMGKTTDVHVLQRLFQTKHLSPVEIERARRIIRRSGALEACLQVAKDHLAKSVQALAQMKVSRTTKNLRWIAETLLPAQRLAT